MRHKQGGRTPARSPGQDPDQGKHAVIETVNDELKNMCQVEHTRHRSINGFLLNLAAGIAASSFFPEKPSIRTQVEETDPGLIHANRTQLQLAA